MDQRVERVFLGLIVIFSISFGILSVFFRSTNILGFSGEYWAGIFCVGVVLLITGWGALLSFRGTRGLDRSSVLRIFGTGDNERVYPLAYITIFIALIGFVAVIYPYLDRKIFCSDEYSSSFSDFIIILPIVCGLISVLLGAISYIKSKKMLSKRNQDWSIAGLLLGMICLLSFPCSVIFMILSDICEMA